jgi:hypothetical protein
MLFQKVQVGCHTDQSYWEETQDRFPQIVFQFLAQNSTLKVGNPFGGLIYIKVSLIVG